MASSVEATQQAIASINATQQLHKQNATTSPSERSNLKGVSGQTTQQAIASTNTMQLLKAQSKRKRNRPREGGAAYPVSK